MRVLAFDTSMSACSVAVWQDHEVLAKSSDSMVHGQSERLVPAIEQALETSAITYAELDRIAVTVGPGSFTGVRVGLATARGLGAATGLPVIGLQTTEVIATAALHTPTHTHTSPIAVAIDARRAEVYLQCFSGDGHPVKAPVCVLPEEAAAQLDGADWMIAGDAAEMVSQHMKHPHHIAAEKTVNVVTLAAMAATAAMMPMVSKTGNQLIADAGPRPVYIRPPDALVPRNGGQLRP